MSQRRQRSKTEDEQMQDVHQASKTVKRKGRSTETDFAKTSRSKSTGSGAKRASSGSQVVGRRHRADEDDSDFEDDKSDAEDGGDFGVLERIKLPERPVPKRPTPKGTLHDFTLEFLRDLKQNNNREWFNMHRSRYEASKDNFLEIVEVVLSALKARDPHLSELSAKACVFRINRDVRFSNDKSPYKQSLSMAIQRDGKKSKYAAWFLQIQPGGQSMVAAGLWCPPVPILQQIRETIAEDETRLTAPLEDAAVGRALGQEGARTRGRELLIKYVSEMAGHALKVAPKGFAKDHPSIDLLRLKSFVLSKSLSDEEVLEPGLAGRVAQFFLVMMPFVNALNEMV